MSIQKNYHPQNNVDITNAILKTATPDYQRRVPIATQANIADTLRTIMEYTATRNEFIPALMNRIGMEIFKSPMFSNPFDKYKRNPMHYGDSIEEVQLGLIQAYSLDTDRETMERMLFGRHQTEAQSSFHKINRQDVYPITINERLLRRAFTAEAGLSTFVTEQMASLHTSDQWDEWLIMNNLFNEYDKADGFFKVQIGDLTDIDVEHHDVTYALKALRRMGDTLPSISRKYNAAGMPIATPKDKLTLFVSASANATLDVDGLAQMYHLDKADYMYNREVVPDEHFFNSGANGAQMILTTEDFFVCLDTVNEQTSQPNAATLEENMFLHRHGIYSASRFVPAIMFTTETGTEVVELTGTPKSISEVTLTDQNDETATELTRGKHHGLSARTITDTNNGVNEGVFYELIGAQSDFSYVSQYGTLHVGYDEVATELAVLVSSIANPDVRTKVVYSVTGELLILWPNPEVITADMVQVTPVAPTKVGSTVIIPEVDGVIYKNLETGDTVSGDVTAPITVFAVPDEGYYFTRDNGLVWSF